MSNGHSWLDIKQYTLSEIGVFIRSIYVKKEQDIINQFSFDWMASNLSYDGMETIMKKLKKSTSKKSATSKEEDIENDWSKLANFSQKS